jgi:hypothetical protein
MNVQVFNVPAGDHIDLLIPFPVQRSEADELFPLPVTKLREVPENDVGVLHRAAGFDRLPPN